MINKKNKIYLLFISGIIIFLSIVGIFPQFRYNNYVNSVVFLPNDKILISAIRNSIVFWDYPNEKIIKMIPAHKKNIRAIAISKDGKYSASCSDDKIIKVWGGIFEKEINQIEEKDVINTIAFSNDAKRIAYGMGSIYDVAQENFVIKIWDVEQRKELMTLSSHKDIVSSVAFSPDNNFFVSASWDKTIKLWDLNTGKVIREFIGHKEKIQSVVFSSDGTFIASGGWDDVIRVWDVNTGKEIKTFRGHSNDVLDVKFSLDNKYIASSSRDNTVKLWEFESGKLLQTYSQNQGPVKSLNFSPDGWLGNCFGQCKSNYQTLGYISYKRNEDIKRKCKLGRYYIFFDGS